MIKFIPHYLNAILVVILATTIHAGKSLEFTGSLGYTVIDFDKVVEEDEASGTTVDNWEHLNFGVSGKYIMALSGSIGLGAEFMYQKLYWYSVRVPYVPQPIYRTYHVEAAKLAPLIRFGAGKVLSLDLGPQFIFFDALTVGVLASATVGIPVSQRISIPLQVKFEMYKGIVLTMPISLNTGIGIHW